MTSTPPARYQSPPFVGPRRPHPGLLAAGIVQLVVTGSACVGYMFIGIGVGMCSDSGDKAFCGRVDADYALTGCAIALNAALGLVTVLGVQRPRRVATCRTLATAVVASLLLLAVVGAQLWVSASSPIT